MELLKRLRRAVADDHLMLVSAGVAFYLFLALFPALFAAVSFYGLVADPGMVHDQLERLEGIVPRSSLDVIGDQLEDVTREPDKGLGWGAALALLVALWSAGKGAKALIKGLNIAYDRRERRHFIKVQAVALAYTFGLLAFLLVSLALIALLPPLIESLPLGFVAAVAAEVGKWTLLFAMILAALAVTYRYAPCIIPPRWIWIAPGSITAGILWLIASAGFSWFAANFGKYNETYGLLAGAVVMLLWFKVSVFVVLLGAELNHALEQRRDDDDPWAQTNAR